MTDEIDSTLMRRPSGRSPSYPALDLEKAISRARELWTRDKQFPTPIVSAVRHWGYKGLSGPAGMTIAALIKYGLAEDEGVKNERKVRVTDLAVKILNHPDPETRQSAIRTAALKPSIHADMWAQYGAELPSDENLMWTLTRDQDFTETGAREFLKEYRQTIQFAKLSEGRAGIASLQHAAQKEELCQPDATAEAAGVGVPVQRPNESEAKVPGSTTPGARRYPIRLLNGQDIIVEGHFPLTDADWAYFYSLLGHMKPAFTGVSPATESRESKDDSL